MPASNISQTLLVPLTGLLPNREKLRRADDVAILAALAASPALGRVFEVPPQAPRHDGPASQPGPEPAAGPEPGFTHKP